MFKPFFEKQDSVLCLEPKTKTRVTLWEQPAIFMTADELEVGKDVKIHDNFQGDLSLIYHSLGSCNLLGVS